MSNYTKTTSLPTLQCINVNNKTIQKRFQKKYDAIQRPLYNEKHCAVAPMHTKKITSGVASNKIKRGVVIMKYVLHGYNVVRSRLGRLNE